MRPPVALALGLALTFAPCARAQEPAPEPAPEPGWVEAAPVLVGSATMALRNDLEILRAALESYRAGHFFRYPEASSLLELVALLIRTEDLPAGFALDGTVTAFVSHRRGYMISARADGEPLTIRPPERFDPFWAMLF